MTPAASLRPIASGALLLLSVAGCAAPPALAVRTTPLSPVAVRSETFAGSPLSGPMDADALPADPTGWLSVDVEILALESFPRDVLDPVAARSGLIARPHDSQPVRALHEDPTATRVGDGDAALSFLDAVRDGTYGPVHSVASGRGALAPNSTLCVLGCLLEGPGDVPPPVPAHGTHLPPPAVGEIELYRQAPHADGSEGALRLALVRTLTGAAPEGEPAERPRLIVSFDPWSGTERTLVVVTPRLRHEGSLVVAYALRPGSDDPLHLAAVAAARDQARAASQDTDLLARPRTPDEILLATATQGLSSAGSRRDVLLLLAEVTDAGLARDLLLWNRDELAEQIAAELLDHDRLETTAPALGWQLERAAYAVAMAVTDESLPQVEFEAVLVRHTGELARHPAVLADLLEGSASLLSFRERLVERNLLYLEDSTPAARLRAFDWLAARSAAPGGFDPLASREARTAALAAAAEPAAR